MIDETKELMEQKVLTESGEIRKELTEGERAVFATMGARNGAIWDRERDDYYSTPENAVTEFLDVFPIPKDKLVWEICVGGGHISEVLKKNGYKVRNSDIIDRGYPDTEVLDFLKYEGEKQDCTILTNPPYKHALSMVYKALNSVNDGNYVIMLLKTLFLESKNRRILFQNHPPKYVYVSSSRINCARNGDFETFNKTNSAISYSWFVWEKGYKGDTIVRWFN